MKKEELARRLSIDGDVWRRLARWGATQGPEWFVRMSPPVIGVSICALAREPRMQVLSNLRRVCGERGGLREALDVSRTFASYASCLTEILSAGSDRARLPEAVVWGEPYVLDSLDDGRGIIFATAHTAGWERVGPLLSRDHGLRLMIAEAPERNEALPKYPGRSASLARIAGHPRW